MICPTCHVIMGVDEPRMNMVVHACEKCGLWREYADGVLVYESHPDEPGKPPVRLH